MHKSDLLIIKQKIKNIDHLKKSIKLSLAVVFFTIFTFALAFFYVLHGRVIRSEIALNQQEVRATIEAYKSNLSEKLSILASSNTFIDYLRSGFLTREKLYPDFLSQIITLKSNSISGMELENQWGEVVFKDGKVSHEKVTLNLCYLNQVLDSNSGDCEFKWTLYFDKKQLISDIQKLDKNISFCDSCMKTPLIANGSFGSFNASIDSNVTLPIDATPKRDYYFDSYVLVMVFSLALLGGWCWFRLNQLLNDHIVNPITKLTRCLKADIFVDDASHIDEIKYLIREISAWRQKIDIIKTDESNQKLSKIAAQLAHDIRSPLGATNMVLKKIASMIPESHFKLLLGATKRIDEIAENFLFQYRNVENTTINLPVEIVNLVGIISDILEEKKIQCMGSSIQWYDFYPILRDECLVSVNSIELKRLLSNLLNNSIEAISGQGRVTVTVNDEGSDLCVSVADTGRGIPSHLLPLITKGGYSTGKENGNGLGLSHAITMIALWGGKMDVTSVEGEGTTVSFKLPRVISPRTPSF